jgi:hypothetical protein
MPRYKILFLKSPVLLNARLIAWLLTFPVLLPEAYTKPAVPNSNFFWSSFSLHFVGVDISKTWFDAALIRSADPSKITQKQFSQTPEGYKKMQQWLQEHDISLQDDTLFCMEYTGIYNTGLVNCLVAATCPTMGRDAFAYKKGRWS